MWQVGLFLCGRPGAIENNKRKDRCMKNRREFLISGAFGTSALLVAADWAKRISQYALDTGRPWLDPTPKADLKIYADRWGKEYTFTLHHPRNYSPPVLTWREWLEGECVDADKPKEIQEWMIEQGYFDPEGGEPFVLPALDEEIPIDLFSVYLDGRYAMEDSPEALAYHFLLGLPLGPDEPEGLEDPIASLDFVEGDFPGSNYTAVTTYDPEAISCLQLRLRQLEIDAEIIVTSLYG